MTEQPREAYDRGHTAGEISARLAGHDKHFASINGSLEKISGLLNALHLRNQQILDQMAADRATALVLTEALKSASQKSWSPWLKGFTVLGALGVAMGILVAVIQVWG